MTDWNQIAVEVPVDDLDAVSGALWGLGIAGIEEQQIDTGSVRLVIGIEAQLRTEVEALLDAAGLAHRVGPVVDDAGLDGWRDHARPVTVGRVMLVPAWLDTPADHGEVVVRLDAGRAFGHGGHVTTRLALDLLQEVLRRGDRVLDLGCGSGVLAVSAALLGAGEVVGVDIDPEAVRATAHNVRCNGVEDVVEVLQGSMEVLDPGDRYDVVVANIEAPVLTDLAGGIAALVAPGGRAVVSGFLASVEPRVRAAFGTFGAVARRVEGEWAGLVLG